MTQTSILARRRPPEQLLKWIGSKHRSAAHIAERLPASFNRYYEPFLGSGSVMATIQPDMGIGSDNYAPLIQIWQALSEHPEELAAWYRDRWEYFVSGDRKERYALIRARFNDEPNGADLLFLCRSCYGGVIRFRKADGHMSTPVGVHSPVRPESFERRVADWHARMRGCMFELADYSEIIDRADDGDLVYCDPPYSHSQRILYGAQDFSFERLLESITRAKARGVFVALSIDGHKRSGDEVLPLELPDGLFAHELMVDKGPSMLKRFQLNGQSAGGQGVADRLLLTY
ncbi:MAG TPA: Dam family site-specific DNA-(adenine-N6)-methyltransferase [Coriobacteriia bacterium]|jgi:DNA adenine methylase